MTSRLQLHLSARELKNIAGLMGTSDPFCVVTVRGDDQNNPPTVIGQTEVVFNNLSPSFSTVLYLEGYKFGVPCYFEVGVFDFDAAAIGKSEQELSRMDVHTQKELTKQAYLKNQKSKRGNKKHKNMGTALFEVGQVLGSRGNVASKSLQPGGIVTVHIEKCQTDGRGQWNLHLQGHQLKPPGGARTAHAFFELFRKVERPTGAVWVSVYRSNTIKHTTQPTWTLVSLDLEATCNGDLSRAIKIVVWDHKRSGKHKYLGECETTVHALVETFQSQTHDHQHGGVVVDHDASPELYGFELMRDGKHVGKLEVLDATLFGALEPDESDHHNPHAITGSLMDNDFDGRTASGSKVSEATRPEFVDYLSGGCQISLAVAIDFTASNGDPREPGTPHYFHPPQSKEWNDYEKAIFAVGSILAKYDSDQRFPVWGFGAKYNGVVRHCFQCGIDVEVEGVQGIMDAYRGVFRTPLTMSFPTRFTEVVETASSYARHEQEMAQEDGKLSYTILLILTSGNVEDAQETKQCLIDCSEDPLSVVIVGIGDENFEPMIFLDEHDPATEAGRDITKFVRFADYRSFNALTEAVLDEIPQQLVEYYYSRNILPGRPETAPGEVEIADADDDERTFTFLG